MEAFKISSGSRDHAHICQLLLAAQSPRAVASTIMACAKKKGSVMHAQSGFHCTIVRSRACRQSMHPKTLAGVENWAPALGRL